MWILNVLFEIFKERPYWCNSFSRICFVLQMVQPTTLKRKHSLKDVNILPLIKRIRAEADQRIAEYARIQVAKRTEETPAEELKGHFEGLTGEDAKDFLTMCGLDYTAENLRILVHHTIIFANEFGHPKGQELRAVSPFFLCNILVFCMLFYN